jgi:IclR family acetate operon transcriptional repressor
MKFGRSTCALPRGVLQFHELPLLLLERPLSTLEVAVVSAQGSNGSFVPALRKGLALLELLAEEGPLTLAQVERHSGLNRTMSYRLLRVMGELGYVSHDPVRHRYDLGSRLLNLGAKAAGRTNLATIAEPYLEAVSEELHETVSLGVLTGGQVVYLSQLGSSRRPGGSMPHGGDAPHATSVGKAILAFLPEAERAPTMASLQPLTPLTPSTIIDPGLLEGELARTRERGFALEDEEHAIGLRGIGVPVLNVQGEPVAALGVAGPVDRIDLSHAGEAAARLWWVSREMSRQIASGPERLAS